MSRIKYEIIEVNQVEITVDLSMLVKTDDMFFNATEMSKQFEKQPRDFLKSGPTKEYIEALIELKTGKDQNLFQESDLIKVRHGGKYQGTWLHQDLALQFARWLSPSFSVRLDFWIKERLREESQRKKARLEAKTGYLELSEAVLNDHDPAKAYHFSNEANLINNIVLGMTSKKFKEINQVEDVRDSLSEFQIYAIKELQSVNASFIKTGIDYQERKERLTKYYNDKLCLPE